MLKAHYHVIILSPVQRRSVQVSLTRQKRQKMFSVFHFLAARLPVPNAATLYAALGEQSGDAGVTRRG